VISDPEDISLDRELGLRGGLAEFVKMAWPIVEPATEYRPNWHIDAVCEHLEAVSRGEIRWLGINIPPGMSKSLLVAAFWPSWDWIQHPEHQFIDVSFDGDLTLRDARRQINLMQSGWFLDRWGHLVRIPEDVAAGDFTNLQGGWRYSTSVGGKMTGRHCDIMIIDDPQKPKDISKKTLETVRLWWKETIPTRFKDQKTGRRVLIMQRLHEADLAGIAQQEPGWEWLRLPMRFEKSACCYTKLGGDIRTEEGELLDPVRFPDEEVKRMERDLGPRGTAAQLQQRPSPEQGAIFQRGWFRHYKAAPARFDQMLQSWDCAFKDTDGSDYVCGGVWGISGAEYYLLDLVWEHLDFPATCAAVEAMTRRWPKTISKLIEDKANGTAVIQTLQKKIPGIIAITPEGGKLARANAVAPLFEAGNVFFPDPSIAPWIDDLEQEMVTFPMAAHDDRVDMVSQVLNYIQTKTANYKAAMAKAKTMFPGLS